MEPIIAWSLIAGAVFLLAALSRGPLESWPISMPAIYLLVGAAIGPWGIGLLDVDLIDDVKTIEALTEIGVLVSLLTAGLELAPSWSHLRRAPIPLATVTMIATIAATALLGVFILGLPIGAAVLLGAVLAPTDPVLARAVHVQHHDDTDRLRYALTGEAGLNDGAAFPFIMLGLGLVGIHEIGAFGWRWVAVDLIWAVGGGIGSGWLTGWSISHLAVWVQRNSKAPAACEEVLTLGLIGLSYGFALWIHTYGFLAVFAAGVATRRYADSEARDEHPDAMMKTVTGINEQFGQVIEVALVILIGILVTHHASDPWSLTATWWVALVLFFLIRPLACWIGLLRSRFSKLQKTLIAFFGIRGVGSLYYLSYAIDEGLEETIALQLGGIVLTAITLSLLIHSNIASNLLGYYQRQS